MVEESFFLVKSYPSLKGKLAHVPLGNFPTPIERLEIIGKEIGLNNLYIKRDDLCSNLYGSNKVRKLEFFLGDALKRNIKEVITMGFAGSNHSLATSIYSNRLNINSISLLLPQMNAHYVRRNLLTSFYYKTKLCYYRNLFNLTFGILKESVQSRIKYKQFPKFIPAGGSSPEGIIAYVNAAFELHEQILAGLMPKPDYIYVALGSTGTYLGLKLGFKILQLDIKIIAIRVIEKFYSPVKNMVKLFNKTSSFLNDKCKEIPLFNLSPNDLIIRDEYLGKGYAHFTEKGVKASELMFSKFGLILNGSYTAKAFAAIIDDAKKIEDKNKVILFWNTYNSCDLKNIISNVDYKQLPYQFHQYFEKDVQPLDQSGFDC